MTRPPCATRRGRSIQAHPTRPRSTRRARRTSHCTRSTRRDQRCAVHWELSDAFAELYPDVEVVEGTFTLSETASLTGYTSAAAWSCATAGGQPVTVTNNNQVSLAAGADVVCSITNTANAPYLTLVKRVVNSGGPAASATNWTLKADGPGAAAGRVGQVTAQ